MTSRRRTQQILRILETAPYAHCDSMPPSPLRPKTLQQIRDTVTTGGRPSYDELCAAILALDELETFGRATIIYIMSLAERSEDARRIYRYGALYLRREEAMRRAPLSARRAQSSKQKRRTP